MLVGKNFLTLFLCPENFFLHPPPQTIFGKKNSSKGLVKKNLSTQPKILEKMIVQVVAQVGNDHPEGGGDDRGLKIKTTHLLLSLTKKSHLIFW